MAMTEAQAWETLTYFARRGGTRIETQMSVGVLRRTLAKVYQPRKATDEDKSMREINACIDVIELERDRRELVGEEEAGGAPSVEPAPRWATSTMGADSHWATASAVARSMGPPRTGWQSTHSAGAPWQTEPGDGDKIYRNDCTDPNFIKKSIHDRASRFGPVELHKAWGWDGNRFRKVISVRGNDYTLEDLGRALLYLQVNGSNPIPCEAVFVTKADGRARRFRLVMLRMGRSCEDVSRYERYYEGEPDDPRLRENLGIWLESVRTQVSADRSHW